MPYEDRIAVRKMMSNYWDNSSPFSVELVGAVIRQGTFIDKMHNLNSLQEPAIISTLERFILKYERFIEIAKVSSKRGHRVAVPTLDVDLVWHTHQLSPPSYYRYTVSRTQKFIDHDDKIVDTKLSTSFQWTSEIYQKMFNHVYSDCLCWYCESTRIGHTSKIRQLFGGPARPAPTHSEGMHISAHGSIEGVTSISREERHGKLKAQLDATYAQVVQQARKRGERPPTREDQYLAWGVPL